MRGITSTVLGEKPIHRKDWPHGAFARLDRASRVRPLTMPESLTLERAIKTIDEDRKHPFWSAEEDEIATDLRSQGRTYLEISRCIPRSAHAIAARLRYLRS